ncbi:MAG: sulfurtransferase FdhD, partial [Candidatus Lokiarchaeota archaeon]|nr:sulfurtransferase FdhD [Candidatus Lokiarchaeota archaeon]
HNTLDKVIGNALISGVNLSESFVITSGRLSAPMVSKIARLNIPIFVSVSAPTSEGVDMAKKNGITLIGFSRNPKMNIYSNKQRIRLS